MIDRTKLEIVEREIKQNLPIPTMYNRILGFYGNLEKESVCCPFHGEKTPSFSYSPALGIWTCFGECSRSGDSIELYKFYLEKYQGMTVSRTRTIQLLMTLPEVSQYLTIDSLEMERTNKSFSEYLNMMMEKGGKKLGKLKSKQLAIIGQINKTSDIEDFKDRYNELLYVKIDITEVEE